MTICNARTAACIRSGLIGIISLLCLCISPAQASDNTSSSAASPADCVILLHGLARNAHSMEKLGQRLENVGYRVANIDYPSRQYTVEVLAPIAINDGLERCISSQNSNAASRIHFVTHSMGGILVREYLSRNTLSNLGRVVMLAPPNQGSEVVDNLGDVPGFEWLNGPAGRQLGTGDTSVPRKLGAAGFDVGVIAGTRSINVLLSVYLPDPDDGKVSVESTRLSGMCDFLTLPVTHPFIMRNNTVIEQVIQYLQHGRFNHADSQLPDNMPSHC